MNELDSLVDTARAAFAEAKTPAELENAKAQFLGKSGRITELMKGMAALSVEEKKSRGAAINVAKQAIEAALTDRRQQLADEELSLQLRAEALDVSLPGRRRIPGGLHPVSRTLERIEEIFSLVQQVVRESGYEEVLSSGVVLTGGSAVMPGMVELGEDIFLKPVRRGIPKYSSALSDMVAQPRAATVMGLLEEARFARMRGFKVAQKNGSVKTAFGRFKDFIVGNF